MSLNGNNCVSFESFLQKRKDTLKLKWVTYWFRLQNTTLFFYTQKHGTASHLRGHYYVYTMQSVREVRNDDRKRFMFEIIMSSGKRKMLAADTAALRKEWVRCLWQAMRLSTSGLGAIHNREATRQQSTHTDIYSDVECLVEPVSSDPPVPGPAAALLTSEDPVYQNLDFQLPKITGNNRPNEEIGLEEAYDFLPARNDFQTTEARTHQDKGVYDCPLSYRRDSDQESPYDVPSALLRKLPDDRIDPEDEIFWKI